MLIGDSALGDVPLATVEEEAGDTTLSTPNARVDAVEGGDRVEGEEGE